MTKQSQSLLCRAINHPIIAHEKAKGNPFAFSFYSIKNLVFQEIHLSGSTPPMKDKSSPTTEACDYLAARRAN
jgi:hypothetical protein